MARYFQRPVGRDPSVVARRVIQRQADNKLGQAAAGDWSRGCKIDPPGRRSKREG